VKVCYQENLIFSEEKRLIMKENVVGMALMGRDVKVK
jgi:hypothetical protein